MKYVQAIRIHMRDNAHRIEVINEFMENNADADERECKKNIFVLEESNKALSEIQQYRAIGTVEECREAREKQRAKKPILDTIYHQQYYCPNCEDFLARKNGNKPHHCICGQAIDWNKTTK